MSDFDPLKPETFDSPHEEYRQLREECPVAHSDTWGGFWALMKHADVSAAASDFRTFITSKQNVIPKVAFTGRRPPLHLDPPEHTHYRRALAPLLSERRVARLEPVIRTISRDLLARMVERGGGDLVAEFSAPMPIATFANWMNLEPDAVAELTQVGRDYNLAVQSNDMDETKRSSLLLYDMARGLVAARKANPMPVSQDATSALLAARVDGETLPEDMIVGTIRQVLVVGIIAPSVTIGAFAVHLGRDQQLQARLRADPTLIPAAVEELLRLYTPYRGFARTAVCPVEFRGRTIPEGEPIAVVYASANRDADVFDDPDSFRLDRDNIKDSLAFGRGPHACVGAALARLELKVALEELLAAAPGFTLAGEPVQTRFPEIGALSVPIRFGAAS
jgi:cytochrome P450